LLLGLIREGEGVAARVLENLGVEFAKLKKTIIEGLPKGTFISPEEQKISRRQLAADASKFLAAFPSPASAEAQRIARDLAQVKHDKEIAIRNQEFDKAAQLREQEVELSEQLKKLSDDATKSKTEDLQLPTVDKYNDSALKSILLAREQSRILGFNTVGTEQILLGLIAEGTGITATVFQSFGIDLDNTREAVEKITGKGHDIKSPYLSLTPRAKKVLIAALKEANQLGLIYIKKEHILLALICGQEGVARPVLENMGVNLAKMKEEIIKLIEQNSEV
jgi:ATP-dependent Clp protease ATP-binding subunit ClpA